MSHSPEILSYEVTHHQTISPIRGVKRTSGVIQYLGVQYATLKDRFARGKLLEAYSDYANKQDGILDATTLGPLPLSPSNGCEWEQLLLQKSLPFPEYPQSDTECLTLNIAVPDVNGAINMPVMVLIHGGGFTTGSSSYPQYDLARITQMSIDINMPMISVGVKILISALKAAGYKPNNGLDDQRLAFRWIKHHIAGFGGDPEKVTFIGESAGAVSGCFHLYSTEPLFHQLIAMGGTSISRPRPPELLEKSFARVSEVLGVKNSSPEEQVHTLVHISLDEIRTKVGRQIPIGPMLDGDIIPIPTTFKALGNEEEAISLFPGISHCKRIIMSDCQMDGMAFASRIAARTDIFPKTLAQCLSSILDPVNNTIAPTLISAYGLDTTITANSHISTKAVLDLGNDICFALGARLFTRLWSASSVPGTEAFLCHFNCPNPWEGAWKGHATHIQDIAFMLQNYSEFLSDGQQKSAKRFATDIIAFVNGRKPWKGYENNKSEGSMVYYAAMEGSKDESGFVEDEIPDKIGRRDILQKLKSLDILDKVMDAWLMFMAGPQ